MRGCTAMRIYIPLCFYFIPSSPLRNSEISEFTFHYASTLWRLSRTIRSGRLNLHSTMLLLYRMGRRLGSGYLLIYIPLCFYFMSYCCCAARTCLIYIPLCFYFIKSSIHPASVLTLFTFHYASTLFKNLSLFSAPCRIYIPLCFYFMEGFALLFYCDSLFTFHYASTLWRTSCAHNNRFLHLHSTMLLLYEKRNSLNCYARKFTFHYASTL